MKYWNYDIVFQEIPDEVTLAVNISNCPNHCPGCHSPHLWGDVGEPLTAEALDGILAPYRSAVTCLCLMGGDAEPEQVDALAAHLRTKHPGLKVAWYSGRQQLSPAVRPEHFDYIKLGPWIAERGTLKQPTTNQRLYRILPDGSMEDITANFWRQAPNLD